MFKCEALLIFFKRREDQNPPWLRQRGGQRMMKCALIKGFRSHISSFDWVSCDSHLKEILPKITTEHAVPRECAGFERNVANNKWIKTPRIFSPLLYLITSTVIVFFFFFFIIAPLIIFQPPQTSVTHLCELGSRFRLILWIKEFLCTQHWHVKWNGCLSNEAV